MPHILWLCILTTGSVALAIGSHWSVSDTLALIQTFIALATLTARDPGAPE
ncbi:hypothetical protein AB0D04_13600 [Streptomyces sp. NPDC048483]|uniref:hypothetical protein n=1 Tax=Streptomyces sp. NPDC048483 TaxID=3154927 RepID=UPI003443E5FA